MKKTDKVVFKRYEMGQPLLLPPSVDELIPEKHLVRVIHELIEKMDLSTIHNTYKGGGNGFFLLHHGNTEKIRRRGENSSPKGRG